MADGAIIPFPLHNVSDRDLQELGKVLWLWRLCGNCDNFASCSQTNCPWSRTKRLSQFWGWYKTTTSEYVPELFYEQPALRTHTDLLKIIQLIKSEPDLPRQELIHRYFASRDGSGNSLPAVSDQGRAFVIAASVLFMVNSATSSQAVDFLEHGYLPIPWRNNLSATQFILESFPTTEHPYFDQGDLSKALDVKGMLAATILTKKAGLRFEATFDLGAHLRMNRKRGTIQIFHQTAILKENLMVRQNTNDSADVNYVTRGNIPRLLALETLDTIHKVLFPPGRDSQALLSSLVSRHGFDQDCLRYESARYRNEDEPESSFPYFGSRLAEIYDELQNPTPRGWFHTWLERKSGARYVMMATVIGVFIAIVIGLLGLGVALFQAWVTYQQWKQSVNARPK